MKWTNASILRSVKTILLILFAGLSLHAEDWTVNGKTYQDVKVILVEPDAVTIMDSDGGARISLADMPADLQKKYGYDPVSAIAAAAKRQADEAASDQALQVEKIKTEAAQAQQAAGMAQAQADADKAANERAQQRTKDAAAQADLETKRKDALYLTGKVLQKLPKGYLVAATPPTPESENLPDGMAVGPDGKWITTAQMLANGPNGVPYLKEATIFLVSNRDLVDGDSITLMLIYETGEFSYQNTLGAQATIRRYEELPPAAQQISSANAFNPGSMNPPQ
jgi:hypothetical protein